MVNKNAQHVGWTKFLKISREKKISNQIDEEKCDAMMSTGDYNG